MSIPAVLPLAIETRSLTRNYGKLAAVKELNLSIPQGSLFGLIGPNGAGKTTTLRMLAGLLDPTSGEIIVNGTPVSRAERGKPNDLRRQIGYMPDFFGVYEDLVVWEYLDFFARCYGLPSKRRRQVIDELLDLVDLSEKRDAYVHTLSRGMRQRLCLAHAMVHDPQVLLLDEPASGLDPRARVEMRELLRELGAMGKTVVLSSHILAELAELCDSIGIIERGHLIVSGRLEDVRARVQAGRRLRIRTLTDPAQVEPFLRSQPGVGQIYRTSGANGNNGNPDANHAPSEPDSPAAGAETINELEVEFTGDENAVADLLEALIAQRVRIASFSETNTGLEEVFLRLTKGEVA
jgi:ABC-2 type transport system ATP-binding protein